MKCFILYAVQNSIVIFGKIRDCGAGLSDV
jgi:hypothetical protein